MTSTLDAAPHVPASVEQRGAAGLRVGAVGSGALTALVGLLGIVVGVKRASLPHYGEYGPTGTVAGVSVMGGRSRLPARATVPVSEGA